MAEPDSQTVGIIHFRCLRLFILSGMSALGFDFEVPEFALGRDICFSSGSVLTLCGKDRREILSMLG
ncbi:MAG: hypothetical protein IPN89_18475 [Saprospiraceae bacterium]|nr:hypothetical protein [Saprospiraceae bacterium]